MNTQPQQSLGLERSYADVCLPKMIGIATANMTALHDQLEGLPKHWATSDKVLVLVFPSLRVEVEAFYSGTGKCMSDMFEPHQIQSIDTAGRDLLRTKLASPPSKTDSSGVLGPVNQIAAPNERVVLHLFQYVRCGSNWYPRRPEKPHVCPKCHSYLWDWPKKGTMSLLFDLH